MSEIQSRLESILIADCGSTTTKVVLLDIVQGQYQFIAYAESPSTINEPWDDVSIGVAQAIRKIEKTTGQTLLDQDNQLITPERGDGKGIDRFLAVSSAAEPLRVILAGLVCGVSLESARRAALSTYTDIVDVISLDQSPGQVKPRNDDDKINAIWHKSPDTILAVGGTDGGATEPVAHMLRDVIRVALYLMGDASPPVIYAGNTALRESVVKTFDGLTSIQTVANVRPLPDAENIGPACEELEVLFFDRKMAYLPGINVLNSWTPSIVLPTARASDYVIRFCERVWRSSKPALSVDIGSASVTLNVCQNKQPLTTVRTDLGVGYGLAGLLEQVKMGDIVRWLPFALDESQARDQLMYKALRPSTIPQTRQELLLIHAAAREALRLALEDSLAGWPQRADGYENMIPPCEPIIASGSLLTRVPSHGHTALILLDALQPLGISTLYLDENNLVPSLGAAGAIDPLISVQTLRNNGLTFLGTVVVPMGPARPGQTVLTVKSTDKASDVKIDIKWGELKAIPLPSLKPGETCELIPARGIDIGQGKGKRHTIEYKGGTVGLIVDARGRPLELHRNDQARREQLDRWLWEMTT
ncbi:MAG: glutamate mutase L [Anaerolineae bacterium]|nr:glutamate mutase L [Anaerolineae bacterium]